MMVGELMATLTLSDAPFLAGIARARSALSGLSGFAASQGRAVGASFASGIASGISANTGAIQSAARAAASAAAAAARAALQIQSPSRVAAQIGQHFGQGLADGIASMQRSVADASTKLAHSAATRAAPDTPAKPTKQTEVQYKTTVGYAPGERPTVLLLDGKEVARTLTEDTNQSLGGRARRLSLGYGG